MASFLTLFGIVMLTVAGGIVLAALLLLSLGYFNQD